MALHNEIEFENEICDHLGSHGWIYEDRVAQNYDRDNAVYTPDLIAWVQEAWPDAWQSLQTKFGAKAEDGIRDRSPSRGLGDVYKRQGCCRSLVQRLLLGCH